MKLSLMFFTIGIFLVVLQTTVQRLLPLGPIVPDLILILCVYWGLHHPTVGAAVGSFLLGYSVDIISSRLLGINAFAMSLVFIAALSRLPFDLAASSDCQFDHRFIGRAGQRPWLGFGLALVFEHRRLLERRGPIYRRGGAHRRGACAVYVCFVSARGKFSGKTSTGGAINPMATLGEINKQDGAPELRRRSLWLFAILIFAFLGLSLRMIFLQVIHGERYTFLSENNRIRLKRVPGTRGMVLDRHGELLVDSRPSFDLFFVPEDSDAPKRPSAHWRVISSGMKTNS
jgi:hypothetical protein